MKNVRFHTSVSLIEKKKSIMKQLKQQASIFGVVLLILFSTFPSEAQDGLVGYWKFDNLEGEYFKDHSEHNNNAIAIGAVMNPGVVGNALHFDGDDDYVIIGDEKSNPPEILMNLGKGSISLWFKVDSIPLKHGIAPILYYGSESKCEFFDAANEGLIIEVGHSPIHYQSERLYFTIWKDGCTYPSFCFDSADPIALGKWYHLVVVVGSNYNTGYLNGKELTRRIYNFGNSSFSQFFEDAIKHERMWLGRGHWDQTVQHLKGAIDELRIYNVPLSTQEVETLYRDTSGIVSAFENTSSSESSILLFPNPASEYIQYDLRGTEFEPLSLEITDLGGKTILSIHEGLSNHGVVNTDGLASGIYHLRFIGKESILEKSMIIH